MKRSLFAGLFVFLLVQAEAIVAEIPEGSKPGTHSTTDNSGAVVASIFDQPSSTDWEQRANQVRELIEMARRRKIPTMVLTLVDKANVPTKTLSSAKAEVETIYQRAGVHVVWDHRDQSNTIQLTVVIVRNCVNKRTCHDDPSAVGTALGSDGGGARWAYVFYNRVRESAEKSSHTTLLKSPSESRILGLAIAHEAGHLLLPLGHAPSGLMRSEIDIATLSDATSDLQFTPEQAERIRNLLVPPVKNPTFAILRIPPAKAFVIANAPKILVPTREERIPSKEQ